MRVTFEQLMNTRLPVLDRCDACGEPIPSPFVVETTRRILDGLDARRRAFLIETYRGAPPTVLCASCFGVTVGSMNQAVTS
jgi:hypothetical protein